MSKGKCIKICQSKDGLIRIYICIKSSDKIYTEILSNQTKKKNFKIIAELIFRNQTNRDFYEKYKNYPNTSVCKLTKGKGKSDNIRIYCKLDKFEENGQIIQAVILIQLHHKKVQELSKKETTILNSIQYRTYEYHESIG